MTLRLPTPDDVTAEFCRRDFYRFVVEAFPYVLPGVEFVPGWHIEYICKTLQAYYEGRIDADVLVINIPPGHMKSLLVGVMYPAWKWTRDQRSRTIALAHSANRATDSSLLCRNLVTSEWYQSLFHVVLAPGDQLKTRYSNTRGGYRNSYGLTDVTGDHGDDIIVDDPMNIDDRYSEAVIKQVNDVWDNVLPSRLLKGGRKIVIMQRLSQNDLAGHIKRLGQKAEFLVLPAEYEGIEVFKSSIGLKDPRKKKGELLWPAMFDAHRLESDKRTMSEMDVAGQLQQRPSPISGNVWKREWFRNRVMNTSIIARFISWDTAISPEETADYSAYIVGEITSKYQLFIREAGRGRWIFPELQRQIENVATRYKFGLAGIAIESKASGMSVMQSLNSGSEVLHKLERELRIDPGHLIMPVNPTQDKRARASLSTNFCEKGMVLLPQPDDWNKDWLHVFEEEIFEWPNSAYLDWGDAFSQLIWFTTKWLEVGLMGARK